MTKIILSLSVVIFLAACTSATPQARLSLSEKAAVETENWRKVKELSAAECGAGPTPPPAKKALEVSGCVSKLVEQYVMPTAVAPQILKSTRAEALRLARFYSTGRMSPVEYKMLSQDRIVKYHRALASYVSKDPAG